jgi:hypothetical protein
LDRHLRHKNNHKCLSKYERQQGISNDRILPDDESTVIGDQQDWGIEIDDYEFNQDEQYDNQDSIWEPSVVRSYNRRYNVTTNGAKTNAYIEVQENFLKSAFGVDTLPSFREGDLNGILRKLACKTTSLKRGTTKAEKTKYADLIRYKLYIAICQFQFESKCNGDKLLQLIKLAVQHKSVISLPSSFRTIRSWIEKQVRATTPEPTVVRVPLPRCWNIQNWPPEAQVKGHVSLVCNDPIALLSMKLVHPQTWSLWGSEIFHDVKHSTLSGGKFYDSLFFTF